MVRCLFVGVRVFLSCRVIANMGGKFMSHGEMIYSTRVVNNVISPRPAAESTNVGAIESAICGNYVFTEL